MKKYKVTTTLGIHNIAADSIVYGSTVVSFKAKKEQQATSIFTGEEESKDLITFSYHHLITIEDTTDA